MNLSQLKQAHEAGKLSGIIKGIENEAYHAGPGESSSTLKKANRSIAHYLAGKTAPDSPTEAMRFGTQAHTLLLEGETVFLSRYFVVPEGIDRRTKAGKEAFEAVILENQGKEAIKFDDYATLFEMREAFERHPIARELVTGGIELSAYWKDPRSDLLCKAKADCFRPDGMIVDLKTTDDASPEQFPTSCARFDYALSAAFYLDGFRQAIEQSGNRNVQAPDAFVFLAVEKSRPYGIGCYVIEPEDLAKGRMKYERALARIKEYESQGAKGYCGYLPQIQSITLPAWA